MSQHEQPIPYDIIYQQRFRCKRCGYIGKQLCDLKRHYNKKRICEARYSNFTYEELLKQLDDGSHHVHTLFTPHIRVQSTYHTPTNQSEQHSQPTSFSNDIGFETRKDTLRVLEVPSLLQSKSALKLALSTICDGIDTEDPIAIYILPSSRKMIQVKQ